MTETESKDRYFRIIREILRMKLSAHAKIIAICLHDRQGLNKYSWPSITTICKDCSISRPTVVKAIRQLEDANVIHVKRPNNPSKKDKASNCYSILLTGKGGELVKELNQLKSLTPTGKGALPQLVKELNPNDSVNDSVNDSGEKQNLFGDCDNPPEDKKDALSFGDFWGIYPKRKGKVDARKAWGKLELTTDLTEKILSGAKEVSRQAEAGQFTGPKGKLQYCKHPATWLNSKGWDDEPDEEPTRGATQAEAAELFGED